MAKGKILIIEDDREINSLLSNFLRENDYDTVAVFEGNTASVYMKEEYYDLILMDMMLPNKSGESLIKELREYSGTPVIVVSAKSMMETRLLALKMGADDYILKPFDLKEVLVRIEVVLRRSRTDVSVLSCGELKLFINENRVTFHDKNIALTLKELQILEMLMKYPQKTFTKANLYETIWKDVYYYEDNTINVHVSNLRSKLKKSTGHDYIETVWGIGYRLKNN